MERNKNKPRTKKVTYELEVGAPSPLNALDGMSAIQRELGGISERLEVIQEDISELKESQKQIERSLEERVQRVEVWVDRLKGALLLISVALTAAMPFLPKILQIMQSL